MTTSELTEALVKLDEELRDGDDTWDVLHFQVNQLLQTLFEKNLIPAEHRRSWNVT